MILAEDTGERPLSNTLLELLEDATVSHGWTVHIGIERSRVNELRKIIQSLAARLPISRLKLWALGQAAPARALIIDNVVLLSSVDWLQLLSRINVDTSSFGFAFESADFAESLRACFIGAERIEDGVKSA
jgi:outer membrane biogenesis lipoprotein LolB